MHRRGVTRSALRAKVAVALVALVAQIGVALPAIAAEGDFIVDGGGWGHGVGMSQYGAYVMGLDGEPAEEIISYYYNGADLAEAQGLGTIPLWVFQPDALAVNVASDRSTLEYRVDIGVIEVCHRGDQTGSDDCGGAPDVTIVAGTELRIEGDGTACIRSVVDAGGEVVEDSEVDGSCSFEITWDDEVEPLPKTRVTVEDVTYARGRFQVRPNALDESFDTVVRLGLEEYLYGIAEVFLSWPSETLEAQAVAARSFAAATVAARGGPDGSGRLPDCGCHIKRTVADQNYDGWLVEGAGFNGVRWREAVDATNDLVVTHPGVGGGSEVVTTYYSSSTGGATEDVEDVFAVPPSPHLVSKDDPWSIDPRSGNPLATWTATVAEGSAALALGWDEVRTMRLVAGPPGSRISFRGIDAGAAVEATWSGWQVRQAFGLRSPYIAGIIKEGPPPPPFTDIEISVHYDDIGIIWRAGVTQGCNPPDNTLYCPTQPVTRAQMASFLVRALDLPSGSPDAFVDDGGSVHEADIDAIAATGITSGCNPPANDEFCPSRAVTRQEMAAFLARAFAYTDSGPGDLFVDDDGSIFEGDIDRLAAAGVTLGCNPPVNDRFCPIDPVTREQMASFLARALSG